MSFKLLKDTELVKKYLNDLKVRIDEIKSIGKNLFLIIAISMTSTILFFCKVLSSLWLTERYQINQVFPPKNKITTDSFYF